MTLPINDLESNITSNIILIPNSKKRLRETSLEVLEKEKINLRVMNSIYLKIFVVSTRMKGNLNKKDKSKFKEISRKNLSI